MTRTLRAGVAVGLAVATLSATTALFPAAGPSRRVVRAAPPQREARAAIPAEALRILDEQVTEAARAHHLPSLALAVVDVAAPSPHLSLVGVSDVETGAPLVPSSVFRIGSLTKTFTATAVMRLRDGGRLRLDEPAETYLPELRRLVYPTSDSPAITVRDLLTHGGGLPRGAATEAATSDEVLGALEGLGLEAVPEVSIGYSNLGFALLGLLAERVAGVPLRELTARELFEPLGMRATWGPPAEGLVRGYARRGGTLEETGPTDLGAAEGSGGLYASIEDLARWARLQLDAWPPRAGAEAGPLRRSTLREMHTLARGGLVAAGPHAAAGGPGLGWQTFSDCELERVVWHKGEIDGYSSAVTILPERGVAVVALANLAGADLEGLDEDVLRRLDRAGVIGPSRVVPSADLAGAAFLVAGLIGDFRADVFEAGVRSAWPARLDRASTERALTEVRDRHGSCDVARPISVASPYSGLFALRCERGEAELAVAIDTARAPRVISLRVGEKGSLSTAEGARAEHCR